MVHECPNCPASNTPLQDFLFYTIGDFDDNNVIEFSQWTTTDRSNLTHHTETVNEYVNIVIEQLHILTVHSYISKWQLRYLKKLKSETDSSTVLFSWWFYRKLPICDTRWSSGVPLEQFPVYSTSSCYLLSREWRTEKYFLLYYLIIYFTDGCAGQYKKSEEP